MPGAPLAIVKPHLDPAPTSSRPRSGDGLACPASAASRRSGLARRLCASRRRRRSSFSPDLVPPCWYAARASTRPSGARLVRNAPRLGAAPALAASSPRRQRSRWVLAQPAAFERDRGGASTSASPTGERPTRAQPRRRAASHCRPRRSVPACIATSAEGARRRRARRGAPPPREKASASGCVRRNHSPRTTGIVGLRPRAFALMRWASRGGFVVRSALPSATSGLRRSARGLGPRGARPPLVRGSR